MEKHIDLEPTSQTIDTANEHAKSRRSFLTKATTGLVIASIPARSVWASGGGIAQSIIASGHGSDFAQGNPLQLLSPGYWMNHHTHFHALKFADVFGGRPFDKNGFASLVVVTSKQPRSIREITFGDILTAQGKLGFKGISNCNFHMVGMYLNAINHGKFGLYFPVIGDGQPFSTAEAFAAYLYSKASSNPSALGSELSSMIDNYHA